MTLQQEKAAQRRVARDRRSQIPDAAARAAAVSLRDNFLGAVTLRTESVVSGYWPIGDEIDVRGLMIALHQRGHSIVLPVVVAPSMPLAFRAWEPDDRLETSVFGTSVPPTGAPELKPQVLLVPALEIDDAGYRLGYGGGYYDRTLQQLRNPLREARRPVAVGVSFACQRVKGTPHGENDQRLDWIVTESSARRVS